MLGQTRCPGLELDPGCAPRLPGSLGDRVLPAVGECFQQNVGALKKVTSQFCETRLAFISLIIAELGCRLLVDVHSCDTFSVLYHFFSCWKLTSSLSSF